ncbi:GGDEF domain-containing protein [Mitsuokella sp. WILCCON 0060]|uniref:GGDEF domain-containing protein n=1 Tax=unclassified Mitsuokella TaxID=2637239 RepID=UPI003F0BD6CF
MTKREEADKGLTRLGLVRRIKELRTVFDVVRVVDPMTNRAFQCSLMGELTPEQDYCYCLWKKNARCCNCISMKALTTQKKASKFEFIDDEAYLVVSDYLQIEGKSYVLENILHLSSDTLVGAYGKNEFVKRITRYNEQMFNDSLTQVKNRRYYDEQVAGMPVQAVAMIDVDRFKTINDTWLHKAGDKALWSVARAIYSCIRKTDILLRYGGDEFLLAFEEIPRDVFARKLDEICEAVRELTVPDYPQLHLSISIGGTYGQGRLQDMLEKADKALYEAKKQRGCVIIRA